jgi:hypothetical protein
VERIVVPNVDVVRRGVLIGFVAKLGSELGGVLVGRNLHRNFALPIVTTRVVRTPHMVFTNSIMIIHVNTIID